MAWAGILEVLPDAPQLLSQAGIRYVCDWANDEQPYPLESPHGELFALPVMVVLDDVAALWDRRVIVDRVPEQSTGCVME